VLPYVCDAYNSHVIQTKQNIQSVYSYWLMGIFHHPAFCSKQRFETVLSLRPQVKTYSVGSNLYKNSWLLHKCNASLLRIEGQPKQEAKMSRERAVCSSLSDYIVDILLVLLSILKMEPIRSSYTELQPDDWSPHFKSFIYASHSHIFY
jgi:hypothetical protein